MDEIEIRKRTSSCSDKEKELYDKFLKHLVIAGKEVPVCTEPLYLKIKIINTRFTQPNMSKSTFNKYSYRPKFQRNNNVSQYHHGMTKNANAFHTTYDYQKKDGMVNRNRLGVDRGNLNKNSYRQRPDFTSDYWHSRHTLASQRKELGEVDTGKNNDSKVQCLHYPFFHPHPALRYLPKTR